MENSSFENNNNSGRESDQVPSQKAHPELEAGNVGVSGFANYLADVLRQEITAFIQRGKSVELPCEDTDDTVIEAGQPDSSQGAPACSASDGCEILDFRPSRPGRPIDDSWGDEPPRNPPPKRFTEDYPRFGGPFPWDFV